MAQARVSAGEQWPLPTAQVVLVYPAGQAASVSRLCAEWRDDFPRADFINLEVAPGSTPAALIDQVRPLIAEPQRAVCVGLLGAGPMSLRLVVTAREPLFRGLVCQNGLPEHQAVVVPHPSSRGLKLRLVWEADGVASSTAAMADVLAVLRAGGIDAQGTLLDAADRGADDGPSPLIEPPAAFRMVRAYLAELVAAALDPAIPTRTNPRR